MNIDYVDLATLMPGGLTGLGHAGVVGSELAELPAVDQMAILAGMDAGELDALDMALSEQLGQLGAAAKKANAQGKAKAAAAAKQKQQQAARLKRQLEEQKKRAAEAEAARKKAEQQARQRQQQLKKQRAAAAAAEKARAEAEAARQKAATQAANRQKALKQRQQQLNKQKAAAAAARTAQQQAEAQRATAQALAQKRQKTVQQKTKTIQNLRKRLAQPGASPAAPAAPTTPDYYSPGGPPMQLPGVEISQSDWGSAGEGMSFGDEAAFDPSAVEIIETGGDEAYVEDPTTGMMLADAAAGGEAFGDPGQVDWFGQNEQVVEVIEEAAPDAGYFEVEQVDAGGSDPYFGDGLIEYVGDDAPQLVEEVIYEDAGDEDGPYMSGDGQLGSWLSKAFRTVTGTKLSNVVAPIVGTAAGAIPVVGTVLGPIAAAAAGGKPQAGPAQPAAAKPKPKPKKPPAPKPAAAAAPSNNSGTMLLLGAVAALALMGGRR